MVQVLKSLISNSVPGLASLFIPAIPKPLSGFHCLLRQYCLYSRPHFRVPTSCYTLPSYHTLSVETSLGHFLLYLLLSTLVVRILWFLSISVSQLSLFSGVSLLGSGHKINHLLIHVNGIIIIEEREEKQLCSYFKGIPP